MELELGLALPNQIPMKEKSCNKYIHRNPRFVDHGNDEEEVESKGLSLLLWSGNNEDDQKWGKTHVDDEEINNDEENQELVGWPPINSLRKELLHRHQGGWVADHRAAAAAAMAEDRVVFPVRNSMYVKVKMEGVPIGRKIDLRRYNSYRALTDALINMFAKYTKNDGRNGEYTILYQDKEGDWLLAGDVPWETFVESVQRMEILRNAY